MDIQEAKKYYDKQLEDEVDSFIEENGDAYINPSPLSPREEQLKKLRSEMLSILKRERIYDDLEGALLLIKEQLPRIVTAEEYDEVEQEFVKALADASKVFDEIEEMSEEDFKEKTFADLMHLSDNTLKLVLNLIIDLYNNENFEDAKKVSVFLFLVAARSIEGGLALGRCLTKLGQYHEAIDVYKYVQEIFPNDPVSRILGAKVCARIGDASEATILLDEAVEQLNTNEELKEIWMPIVEQVKKNI
jgi:tetratricopeptide (TPR) repeat protein